MSDSAYSFEVIQQDLTTTRCIDVPAIESVQLLAGQALIKVEKFALTANNITYGVAGDLIGYWQFFPAADQWGRIPVWGIGTVLTAGSSGLTEGDQYYGYFSMSTYLVVSPGHITSRGFTDAAEHRAALPVVYNQYSLMTTDNGFDRAIDNQYMVYRPLFVTSFILDDFLFDNQFFGATNIILSSASSKTSFGLAYMLHKNRDVKVTGLTSAGNRQFVESLGIYDQVVTYDEIATLDASQSVTFVDMAGNRSVLEKLHHHFTDHMVNSTGVGITHWESRDGQPPAALPGAKPTMFFAPTEIQRRIKDSGPAKFQQDLDTAWQGFLGAVDSWVTINHSTGQEALTSTYQTVLNGASPDQGYVVSL